MLKFGIIAEGPTDQIVIENILLGYFEDQEDEPAIQHIQPPRPWTEKPAGWGHVFKSLQRKDCEGALQFNDYVVIHIDTDVQEEFGFDVPRREQGVELELPDRVARVMARLKQDIDPEFCQANAHRILFAIAVETIECWLLPLLHNNKKAAKTTGCLEEASHQLRKTNNKGLASTDGDKFPRAYDAASKDYRKRKTLLKHRDRNPSLEIFVKQLDAMQGRLTANQAPIPQEPSSAASEHESPPECAGNDQPG